MKYNPSMHSNIFFQFELNILLNYPAHHISGTICPFFSERLTSNPSSNLVLRLVFGPSPLKNNYSTYPLRIIIFFGCVVWQFQANRRFRWVIWTEIMKDVFLFHWTFAYPLKTVTWRTPLWLVELRILVKAAL